MLDEEAPSAALVTVVVEYPDSLVIGDLHLIQDALIGHDGIQLLVVRQHGDEACIVLIQLVGIASEETVDDPLVRRYHCRERHAVQDTKGQYRQQLLQAGGHVAVGSGDGVFASVEDLRGRLYGRCREIGVLVDYLEYSRIVCLCGRQYAAGEAEQGEGLELQLVAQLIQRQLYARLHGKSRPVVYEAQPVAQRHRRIALYRL